MKLLLLPLVAPLAVAWVLGSIFLVMIPAEIVGFSLIALGYSKQGDAIMDGAMSFMFFETPPWTWLRDAR